MATIVCSECGSENIQQLEWRYVNSGKFAGTGGEEPDDTWCEQCCGTVVFCTKEEYELANNPKEKTYVVNFTRTYFLTETDLKATGIDDTLDNEELAEVIAKNMLNEELATLTATDDDFVCSVEEKEE